MTANTINHLVGPYRVPHYRAHGDNVVTHKTFAAAYRGADELVAPATVRPEALAGLVAGSAEPPAAWLAVGNGAIAFRDQLEPAAVAVPADGNPCHRVSAVAICRLAAASAPVARDALVPEYVRLPDAEEARRRKQR
jgi:tRNA threonylcarbamoyladenosine biosynthesis protein TsaB